MLEARQVSFRYGKRTPWILKGVDLLLKPNEVVGLSGPSGRGKTTQGKILAGYLSPTEGGVFLDGEPLYKGHVTPYAKTGHENPETCNGGDFPINSAQSAFWRLRFSKKSTSAANGICPVQLLFQHPELTVNPRWKIGDILSEAAFPSPDLLDELSIDKRWMGRYPHELSGGEIQRVCLARVLASDRIRYLICDEMTAMLDALTQVGIWHTVLNAAEKRGIGILVISHDPALISRICHREIRLLEN